MDTNIQEKRDATYAVANKAIQELYGNLDLGGALGKVIDAHALNETIAFEFINVIGDAILGLIPKKDIVLYLTIKIGFDQESATQIELDLKEFLDKIDTSVPQVPEAPKDVRERLDLRPAGVPPTNPQLVGTPDPSRPLTRDELMRALAPQRTMGSDVQALNQNSGTAVHGYEAAQREADMGQ